MHHRSVELAELPRGAATHSDGSSSVHKDDGDERQPTGDEYRLMDQHQYIEATSFHRQDEEQTESSDKHEYLLFSFRNFGERGILINVILGPILIIANAVIVQVLEDRRKVNTGSIMCIRSLIVLAVICFQSRNTNMISLDFGPDKQTVMGCALALAVSNFAFILCLTNISIAAAFALIVMINPLSLLFTKQWKFRYTWTELGILLSCVVGIAVMGIPWASRQTGGICIGVACLLINYMYQAERNNLTQPVPLIKFIYLSNVVSAVLGLIFMVFIGLQWIDWVSLLMIAGGAICYLLGIELIHRVNATFHDEFVHIIYYLYIIIGFLFDSTLGLKNTEQYDLIGAVLILVASYYGKNMVIVGNFWNMVRYGTPSAPSLFDSE